LSVALIERGQFPGSKNIFGGVIYKGGIFINKDTISIAVGVYLNQLINKGFNPYQLLSRFKNHPLIKRLISGSERIEYQSKLIPKGDEADRPPLFLMGFW